MTRTRLLLLLPLLSLALGAVASPGGSAGAPAAAQEHPVGGLRISDATGAAVGEVPSPPGEKHFHLDSGVKGFHIAFDYSGGGASTVEVRVLGPMGTILYNEVKECDSPGTFVMEFDNGTGLDDNEYVVNAYVGTESYLADILQLAIGAASIKESLVDEVPVATSGTAASQSERLEPVQSPGAAESAEGSVPGGPSSWMLLLAGLGVLALLAVVLWAARSATRA